MYFKYDSIIKYDTRYQLVLLNMIVLLKMIALLNVVLLFNMIVLLNIFYSNRGSQEGCSGFDVCMYVCTRYVCMDILIAEHGSTE